MEAAQTHVFGESGYLGEVEGDARGGDLTVRLENGDRVLIGRDQLRSRSDGSLLLTTPVDRLSRVISVATLPLAEEQLSVQTVRRPQGRVLVHVSPSTRTEHIAVPLKEEHVEAHHVQVRRFVDSVPPVREEGDTLIVPVMEEVLVVEKRLMVREEIHLVRKPSTRVDERTVALRSEDVRVTREDKPR